MQRPSAYKPATFEGHRALFITTFMRDLEKPYISFLTAQLNEVVGRNEAIFGAPCYYLGDTVYARNLVVAKIGKYKLGGMATLDPSLQGAHDEWREHYEEHNASWQRFSQSLKVVLLAAKDWQMLRNMFPDHVLRPYLDEWATQGLTRTGPDLHTARPQQSTDDGDTWDPKLVQQYAAISNKVDLYVGYRLL